MKKIHIGMFEIFLLINFIVRVKVYARPLLLLSAILACPGQSSVFRLMPMLAGGYGGEASRPPCTTTVVQGFPAEYSLKSQHH